MSSLLLHVFAQLGPLGHEVGLELGGVLLFSRRVVAIAVVDKPLGCLPVVEEPPVVDDPASVDQHAFRLFEALFMRDRDVLDLGFQEADFVFVVAGDDCPNHQPDHRSRHDNSEKREHNSTCANPLDEESWRWQTKSMLKNERCCWATK